MGLFDKLKSIISNKNKILEEVKEEVNDDVGTDTNVLDSTYLEMQDKNEEAKEIET